MTQLKPFPSSTGSPTVAFTHTTVESPDGTPIAVISVGAGPPLVVCHGSFATGADWSDVAWRLAESRTVHLYDRRGHGATPAGSDGDPIDVELDDLAAVVAHAGVGAAVLGHSFGGGCALSWAARDAFTGTLIVYEPRHAIDGPVSRGQAAHLRAILKTETPEHVLAEILDLVIGLNKEQVAALRELPLWNRMVETVRPFPAEVDLLDTLRWTPGDLDGFTGPAWLIVGEDSPVLPADREGALLGVLKDLTRVTLPGQGHFAYTTAPEQLASTILRCLRPTP